MAPLWTYYVGRNINPSSMGVYGGALAAQRRRKLLNLALRIGTIRVDQVSPVDRRLLDMKTGGPSTDNGGGGILGAVGSVVSDIGRGVGNLGSDLGDMATHLPGGLYETGKAIVQDIGDGPQLPSWMDPDPTREKSNFEKRVWDPTTQSAKSDVVTLAELATGRPERFLEHPLNPLLTLGAAFSGGATLAGRSGGALARSQAMAGRPESTLASVGRRMARITSPEGRSPTLSNFTRRYSTAPTFKLGQIAADRLVESRVGNRLNLPILQDRRAMRRFLDQTFGEAKQATEHRISLVNRPLAQSLTHMSPEERVATYYALRGLNSPDLVAAYISRLRESLERTHEAALGNAVEGDYIGRFGKDLVSPDAARVQLENLSNPQVLNFLENPTQQMRDFGVMWDDYITSRHPDLGIDPEQHAEHVGALQRELNPELEDLQVPEGGIRPTYVPDMAARDMSFQPTRRFSFARGPFARNDRLSGVFRGPIRSPEPLRNPIAPYLKGSSLETVLTGAQRTDPRLFLDHVRRIEDDLVMREFNVGTVEHLAFKGDDGATMSFRSSDDMNRALVERMGNARASPIATPDEWKKWDPRNWVLITPDLPVRWYREGHNTVESVLRALDEQGIDVNAVTRADLERLLADGARGFWESVLGATRNPGVAIPRTAFRRVVDNIEASRPYMPGVAQYARVLNTWRTLTLAYMPRWLVNTAVGSTLMAMSKGLFNPRHYAQGMRLARNDSLPASVRLGGVVHGEALEAGSRVGLSRFPVTRGIFKAVQSVEDFFRQASFVQSLERGARQKMGEQAIILDKYRSFWNRDRDEYIDNLIRTEPDLVRNAIEDVDRFAYNFTSLSPFERRYIRLFIPFWGWYKFITKFAYRLPTAYPGRTRIIAAISDIGERLEEEQGPIPPWIKGSIILGREDGVLKYVPTLGLNPISQFANPFSDEGAVSGLIRLGQLSPVLQAGLSGMGINTMDAGQQAISPLEGVANDWTGSLVDMRTGEPVELQGRAAGRRVLRSLLTSVPQIRLADLAANRGRPAYPESIPLLEHRTMPVQDISRRDVSPLGILNQFVGAQPRNYNVRKYQKNLRKRAKYARSVARRQLRAGR